MYINHPGVNFQIPIEEYLPFSAHVQQQKRAPSKLQKTHSKNHRKSVTCFNPWVLNRKKTRWWFQRFFIFIPTWERFPFWVIFVKWVETQPPTRRSLKWIDFFHSKLSSLSLTFHPRYPQKHPGELHTWKLSMVFSYPQEKWQA